MAREMKDLSAEVAVIGGGLAGVAVALRLAQDGVDTVILERGPINREASGTNAGTLHFQLRRHDVLGPSRLQLIGPSITEWHRLIEEFGDRLGPKRQGGLMVAEGREQAAQLTSVLVQNQRAGLTVDMLEGGRLKSFAPYLSKQVTAAIYCEEEGSVNPLATTLVLARRAEELGVRLNEYSPVTAIERLSPGFALRTPAGGMRVRTIVNAAGAWSGQVAKLAGLRVPVSGVRQIVSVTERWPSLLPQLVQHVVEPLTLKQTLDNTFLIGGGWPAECPGRGQSAGVDTESAAGNLYIAARLVPELRIPRITRIWPGTIAVVPDRSPIVGVSRCEPGWYTLVVPRGAAGYTVTPYLARCLAKKIRGEALPPSFETLSPDRWE